MKPRHPNVEWIKKVLADLERDRGNPQIAALMDRAGSRIGSWLGRARRHGAGTGVRAAAGARAARKSFSRASTADISSGSARPASALKARVARPGSRRSGARHDAHELSIRHKIASDIPTKLWNVTALCLGARRCRHGADREEGWNFSPGTILRMRCLWHGDDTGAKTRLGPWALCRNIGRGSPRRNSPAGLAARRPWSIRIVSAMMRRSNASAAGPSFARCANSACGGGNGRNLGLRPVA